MIITVFGASGKVGQKVVARLLEQNHQVRAFVYGQSFFEDNPKLKVIQGNVKDAVAVEDALRGVDAVVSTLGSWGTKTKDILSSGMKNIIPAMENNGVKRIVSLTGADALLIGEKAGLIQQTSRFLLGLVANKVLHDGEIHLRLLEDSNLDWTVIRSPLMNQAGSVGYRLDESVARPWSTINRDAVAAALIQVLEQRAFIKQAPIIHRA